MAEAQHYTKQFRERLTLTSAKVSFHNVNYVSLKDKRIIKMF